MTTRSETGGLGDGSGTGPDALTYEYLAEQGLDLRLFLQQALNAEGTDGLRAIAAALDHTRISTASYERIESIAALEEFKSSACALQAKTTCIYDDEVAERRATKRERMLNPSWGVGPEIAFARHQPPRTGAQYLDFCHVLTGDLVFSYDALHCGAITEAEAFIIVKETRALTREQRGEIDIRLFSGGAPIFWARGQEACGPDPEMGAGLRVGKRSRP